MLQAFASGRYILMVYVIHYINRGNVPRTIITTTIPCDKLFCAFENLSLTVPRQAFSAAQGSAEQLPPYDAQYRRDACWEGE